MAYSDPKGTSIVRTLSSKFSLGGTEATGSREGLKLSCKLEKVFDYMNVELRRVHRSYL